MNRLDKLEAQSIYIFREAFERLHKLALLWSLGKDSNVMIWLARKAFFGRVPFPVMHVDTGKKFPEMYAFRDRYAKEWGLDLIVEPCPPIAAVDPTLPPAARSAARKTEGLKLALAKHGFDGLFAGIRRDEEATRAKERVFSRVAPRASGTCATSRLNSGTTSTLRRRPARICACIRSCIGQRATSGDYTRRQRIPIMPLYLSPTASGIARSETPHTSPMRIRRGSLERSSRARRHQDPEHSGRAMDHESEDAFERLRTAGYL